MSRLFVERGAPVYIRSDNGPELTAELLREWLKQLDVQTLFIDPGSPWENGYVESFKGKLRVLASTGRHGVKRSAVPCPNCVASAELAWHAERKWHACKFSFARRASNDRPIG